MATAVLMQTDQKKQPCLAAKACPLRDKNQFCCRESIHNWIHPMFFAVWLQDSTLIQVRHWLNMFLIPILLWHFIIKCDRDVTRDRLLSLVQKDVMGEGHFRALTFYENTVYTGYYLKCYHCHSNKQTEKLVFTYQCRSQFHFSPNPKH